MSFENYHHGTRLMESSETPVLLKISQTSVVAIMGTAPDANADKFPLNVPVLVKGNPTEAAGLGDTGTLKDAVDDVYDQQATYLIIIRVEEGADRAATLSNLVGDATQMTGVHALKKAMPQLGLTPRLVAIPGFSAPDDPAVVNPVVTELVGVLDDLGAVAFVDGPDTTDEQAVTYRTKIGSQRIYIVDPKVRVWSTEANAYVSRPASARFAGVQAHVDENLGFWHSLDNKPINGIAGTSRTVAYGTQANHLNGNNVGTIINLGSGFITWGSRSATSDDLWQFLSVRRTADFINEALEKAYLEFIGKPFSPANIKLMVESGNAAMRRFKASGAILGGKVWFDGSRNDETELVAGKITLGVKFEPPAPIEDIRLLAHRDITYYRDLAKAALKAAA